jgi:hypothetical protein
MSGLVLSANTITGLVEWIDFIQCLTGLFPPETQFLHSFKGFDIYSNYVFNVMMLIMPFWVKSPT